jgi:RHS repeat-associated protein
MRNIYFSSVFIISCLSAVHAQSPDKNFILTRTYKTPVAAVSGDIGVATQQVNYADGLGRQLQSISAHASPDVSGTVPSDILTGHTEYDGAGRVSKVYAPYPVQGSGIYQGGANTGSVNYYNSSANFCLPSNRGYALTEYEQSPLSRVKKQFGIGTDKAVEYYYGVNGADVKLYNVSAAYVLSTSGNYTAGQLTYTETKDESGKIVREYQDHEGKAVLKRGYNSTDPLNPYTNPFDTYYVYNDLSQLCFVLQPQYQDEGSLSKFAFQYQYNDRGLVSSKSIPGGGTTVMYYDNRDRLVRTTDGRGINSYIKYDELNRVIETGEGIVGSGEQALVKTFYDSYPASIASAFVNITDGYPGTSKTNVTGLVTVTGTRILNPDASTANPHGTYGNWLYTTTYYDERYNVIQTVRNLFDLGGTSLERVTRQVRFDGRIEKERTVQETGTGTYLVEKIYNYDHADRLLDTRYVVKKYVGLNADLKKDITLSASRYDGIGHLKSKYLHSTVSGVFVEQLDQCFTPRGFLSKVSGKSTSGDNFGFELKYSNPSSAAAQHNGNISEMTWRQGTGGWVGYKFAYDGANRLITAEGLTGVSGLADYAYHEKIGSYDKNGNIKSLERKANGVTWDNLIYSYTDGNRLSKVTDSGSASEGFKNGSSGDGDDYVYDGNGNTIQDSNRGIGNGDLKYNVLNLVREVVINGITLQYHYDAGGSKLRMSNSNGAVNTKYAGAFEYNNGNYLTRIATEEGQIVITNNGNDYAVEYYLKDHLGNTGMVINESGTMVQETEYFPFGLAISKTAGSNKYLFLGKETQPETNWIDLQARFFDPAIGRFMVIDPETEGQDGFSPYHYSFNNPIRFSDPDGRWPGEGLFNSIKNWLNTPLTKEQKNASRGLNQSFSGQDYASQTRGDVLLTSIGQGIKHGLGHGLPGNSKTSGLPKSVMNGPAGITKQVPSARSAATNYAKEIKETSVNKIPTMTAAAVDTKTGNVYLGVSGKPHPVELHPSLAETAPNPSKMPWSVCNCAETKAVNTALNDGALIENIIYHTVRTKTLTSEAPCLNCQQTLQKAKQE